MTRPHGVILAGGKALRMGGGDKSLRLLGGKPILAHVIACLEPQVEGLALNANGPPERFSDWQLPVIEDGAKGHLGPLAGVLAGLQWGAQIGAESIVTVAADTPFFPSDLVSRLCAGAEEAGMPIALAATPDGSRNARHPTFGLWPTRLQHDLREALEEGVRKVVLWADRHGAVSVPFSNEPNDPFFNINTVEDLAQAEAMMGPEAK